MKQQLTEVRNPEQNNLLKIKVPIFKPRDAGIAKEKVYSIYFTHQQIFLLVYHFVVKLINFTTKW